MANNVRNIHKPETNSNISNRFLLGFAVTLGIYLVFNHLNPKLEAQTNEGEVVQQVDPLNPSASDVFRKDILTPKIEQSEKQVEFETQKFDITIDLKGAKVTDLQLKDYLKDKKGDDLVSVFYEGKEGSKNAVSFDSGWLADRMLTPNRTTEWSLVEKGKDHITLKFENSKDVEFFRTFLFNDENYITEIKDVVRNKGEEPISLVHYSQIHHKGERENKLANSFTNFTGPEALVDNKHIKADYKDLQKGDIFFQKGKNVWAASTTQYFAGVIIPDNSQENSVDFKYNRIGDANFYSTIVKSPVKSVEPNQEISLVTKLYAGPKSSLILAEQGVDPAINLPAMLDYGWFHIIAKLIFDAISFVNEYVHSLAISVILITILLKVLLFPLANKSYHSMAEMKKIQPEIQKLQDKYGNDRQALGLEMMNLYKKHKVNPASGCWPMLIQIPIFFAMYKVILMSFEFRQAELGFWINDMSSRDPLFILPILMGLTMVIQQRLNPQPADETQKMVMNALPYAFTVMFLFFPAGLVLYWLTNNVLSIIQQYIIMKRHG